MMDLSWQQSDLNVGQCVFLGTPDPYVWWQADRDTGKSYAGILRAIAYMHDHPGCRGVVAHPAYQTLHHWLWKHFMRLTPSAWITHINTTEQAIEFANGACVVFRHVQDGGIHRIQGMALDFAYLDDAHLAPPGVVGYLLARLRGADPAMWVTSDAVDPPPGPPWQVVGPHSLATPEG